MKKKSTIIKNFLSIICLIVISSNAFAQIGRLPTQQEIDLKEALRIQYLSNSGNKGSQNHLAATGPEQDCDNAIPVCTQTYNQTTSYTGRGTIQEVNGTCLSSRETNSVWYVFTVQNSGTFSFLLNTTNDYDFALYNITTIGCVGVPSATPVRCNFSATFGNTGLTLPASATIPLSNGAGGSSTMPGLNVTVGQTYVLIIDNFSANTNGYNLTFGGTAQIFDNTPPTISSSAYVCAANSLRINFSEPVLCSSIVANGSDFTITGPAGVVPVTSAVGNLCSTGASNTSFSTINFNMAGQTSGTYTVSINSGSDGNTIIDKCGNIMSLATQVTFQYLAPIIISASTTSVCAGAPVTLTMVVNGTPAGQTYAWAPSGITTTTLTVNPNTAITYIATVTYGGCTRSASQTIGITLPPVVSVNPANASLCSGTTNITASAMSGGSPCVNCNYVWTGTTPQTDNAVPSSTITGAGAGSYSVSVTSSGGCVGNTAVSNIGILSPASPPSCDIIYVSPLGSGTGITKGSPTNIQNALTLAACNAITIKMAVGDYSLTAPLNINSFVTIEGGYNVSFTQKSSSKAVTALFPNSSTRLIRSSSNAEGANTRYTCINVAAASNNFRIQDITIIMPNAPAGSAISNYGIYLGSSCSNYNIVRCLINSGNAGSGVTGSPSGAASLTGGNGGTGSAGNFDNDNVVGTGGGGGGGAGTTVGNNGGNATGNFNATNNCGVGTMIGGPGGTAGTTGGNGAPGGSDTDDCGNGFTGQQGGAGAISTNSRSGGGGGGGGTGGSAVTGLAGGAGGGVLSIFGPNTTGGTGGSSSGFFGSSGFSGTNGSVGSTGTSGSVGATGSAGTDVSGYFSVGLAGGIGGNGSGGQGGKGGGGGGGQDCGLCFFGSGSGGGGGGGGGQGGVGGSGATGGGSTYGIFIFNNGLGGIISDCQIINGLAGAGGTGGTGGAGGNGGTGGLGSPYANQVGIGGNGGAGGAGGVGGNGGSGAAGFAVAVNTVGGSALVANASTFSLTTQPVMVVENIACSNISIAHTSTVSSPSWSSFGISAVPASAVGSPTATVYSALGRKTVVLNTSSYTDFNNIQVSPPSTGNVLASAAAICPGTVNFNSSVAGTPGLTYNWSVLPSGATISSANTSSTGVTFGNATASVIIYTVTLTISSECCGVLTPVVQTITVSPIPAGPTALVNTACIGGIATFTATSPVGSSFSWFDAPVAGNLLGSNNTYAVNNVTTTTTVYLQATNSGGCTSTLTPVAITPTAVIAPTAITAVSCEPGLITVNINPAAGVTNYTWYSDAAATVTVQSGASLGYSQNIATSGGSFTVYVNSNVAGCNNSALIPVTGSVTGTPIVANQTALPSNSVCLNSTFTLAVNPTGGSGAYTYSWTPVASTTNSITQTLTNSTSYGVVITSGFCSKFISMPVIVLPSPIANAGTSATLTCFNQVATLNGTGGGNYAWSGPGTILGGSTATPTINTVGVYQVTVTALGCSNTSTVEVFQNLATAATTVSIGGTLPCGTSSVSLNSAIAGLSYTWTAPSGATVTSGLNSQDAIGQGGGTYTLNTLNAVSGCTASITLFVDVKVPPSVNTNATGIFPCGLTTTTLNASSTNPNVTYSWTGPNGSSVSSGNTTSTPTINDLGNYTVTVTDAVSGCSSVATVSVTQGTITAGIVASPTTGLAPLTVNFTDASTGANTYNWNFGSSAIPNSTNPNPNAIFNTNGTYVVTLIASSGSCSDTATVIIIVNDGLTLEIPNVFTPNGDGTNDFFTIKSTGVKEISLQIFNRWGTKLYEFVGAKAAWDGLTEQAAKVSDGTYFYFVKAIGFDDKKIEKNGTVNLFR